MSGDCCASAPEVARGVGGECPACGRRGRRVKPITLQALLRPGAAPAIGRYRFCGTPGCAVAYFAEEGGEQVPVEAVTVPIGQKLRGPERPICYCFGYTEADILADPEGVPGRIAERCRRGEDRCPETNPQGSCCLGNVRAVIKAS